eukprot:scpid67974/ scgid22900/ 
MDSSEFEDLDGSGSGTTEYSCRPVSNLSHAIKPNPTDTIVCHTYHVIPQWHSVVHLTSSTAKKRTIDHYASESELTGNFWKKVWAGPLKKCLVCCQCWSLDLKRLVTMVTEFSATTVLKYIGHPCLSGT